MDRQGEKSVQSFNSYENMFLEDIQRFTIEQLKFWIEDDFASLQEMVMELFQQVQLQENWQWYYMA